MWPLKRSMFEVLDEAAAAPLIATAEQWLREQGMITVSVVLLAMQFLTGVQAFPL